MLSDLAGKTLNYLSSGGGVMWPLLIISLAMWWLIFKKFADFYLSRMRERSLQECLSSLDQGELVGCPWQVEMLKHFEQSRDLPEERVYSLLMKLKTKQEYRIDKYINTILVMSGAAPLLGLLGTVGGMITTFEVIAWFGTGNPKAMSSGISEALITTQTGLLVAVPGLILGNFLKRRAESIKSRMHRFCLGLLRKGC